MEIHNETTSDNELNFLQEALYAALQASPKHRVWWIYDPKEGCMAPLLTTEVGNLRTSLSLSTIQGAVLQMERHAPVAPDLTQWAGVVLERINPLLCWGRFDLHRNRIRYLLPLDEVTPEPGDALEKALELGLNTMLEHLGKHTELDEEQEVLVFSALRRVVNG